MCHDFGETSLMSPWKAAWPWLLSQGIPKAKVDCVSNDDLANIRALYKPKVSEVLLAELREWPKVTDYWYRVPLSVCALSPVLPTCTSKLFCFTEKNGKGWGWGFLDPPRGTEGHTDPSEAVQETLERDSKVSGLSWIWDPRSLPPYLASWRAGISRFG